MTVKRIQSGNRFSQAVIHGNTIYTTGQVALDSPGASTASQTKEVLSRIDALLAEAKTDKSKLISATIWLANIKDYDEMNKVWDAWVVPGKPPARVCTGSKLVSPNFSVEISVIGAL